MRLFKIIVLLLVSETIVSAQVAPIEIRYMPLGDSYTFCEGVDYEKTWPVLLANDLEKKGIKLNMIDNPAHTGYTTQHLLENEIPVLAAAKIDFVTLLIGVNDWIKGADSATFAERYTVVLDSIQANISDPKKLLLITIPDFSVTPRGAEFSGGRNVSQGISQYNSFIEYIGKRRKLAVVDIFPLSQKMYKNPELIGEDGVHPSAEEYVLWEELIFFAAFQILHRR